MEIFFTSVFVWFETTLLLILLGVIGIILASYGYEYIARIIKIFGPNKRDAKLEARDVEVLKKREENEEKAVDEAEELPPPITLEEIEETKKVDEEVEIIVETQEKNENDLEDLNKEIKVENFEKSEEKNLEENTEGNVENTGESLILEKIRQAETDEKLTNLEWDVSEKIFEKTLENEEKIEKAGKEVVENVVNLEEKNISGDVEEVQEDNKKVEKNIENFENSEEKNIENREENSQENNDEKLEEDLKNILENNLEEKNVEVSENISSEEKNEEIKEDFENVETETIDSEKEKSESEVVEVENISGEVNSEIFEKNIEETLSEELEKDQAADTKPEHNEEEVENYHKKEWDTEISVKNSDQEKEEKSEEIGIEKDNWEKIEEEKNIAENEKSELDEVVEVENEEKISEEGLSDEEKISESEENNPEIENIEDISEKSENAVEISEEKLADSSEKEIEELSEKPENIHKTFDEIEKESDDFFPEMKLPEKKEKKTEEALEEKLSELSEQAEKLLEKSHENVREIIERDVPKEKKVEQYTEELFELTNQAKTFIARGMLAEARVTVIEGLSLKKNHRDLNLLLGEIYEKEGNFEKAKIIYKDLAIDYTEDGEILEKLANVLIIYREWTIAYEIYKKILSLGYDKENTLFMLVNIAKEIEDFSDVYQYSRAYLKDWPNDKDMIASLSEAQILLGKRKEAIETLIKLKNLSPYEAVEIQDFIDKLIIEEENSKNFPNIQE